MANITNGSVFTGCDMRVHIAGKECAQLSAIHVSKTRETLPVFTVGSTNYRAVARGKRGIAGSLVFTNFDKDALLFEHFGDYITKDKYATLYGATYAQIAKLLSSGVTNQYDARNSIAPTNVLGSDLASIATLGVKVPPYYDNNDTSFVQALEHTIREQGKGTIRYADELPEFDITITFVNNLGRSAFAQIRGVTIVNEGSGWSMDELISETAYSYIAREATPLISASTSYTTDMATISALNPVAG